MSRYNLQSRVDGLEVVVGYDPPLTTFFAQVIRPGPEDDLEIEDEMIVWTGCKPYEHITLERIKDMIAPYATIPFDIEGRLLEDSSEPYQLSPLQIFARSLMK